MSDSPLKRLSSRLCCDPAMAGFGRTVWIDVPGPAHLRVMLVPRRFNLTTEESAIITEEMNMGVLVVDDDEWDWFGAKIPDGYLLADIPRPT